MASSFKFDGQYAYILQGSETSYIYGITFFVFFPVFCVCAGYGFIKVNNSKRKRAKANEPDATCFNSGNGPGLTGVGIKVFPDLDLEIVLLPKEYRYTKPGRAVPD